MRNIPNFPDYTIDEEGRVFSKRRQIFLKPSLYRNPKYFNHGLYQNGKLKNKSLHVLLAETFLPNPRKLPFVCHQDGNSKNNSLSNLKWGTAKENQLDRRAHGTAPIFENNGRAKLNRDIVATIKILYKKGRISQSKIADLFHVHQTQISRVISGKSWSLTQTQ